MKRFVLFLLLASIATASINAQDTDSINSPDHVVRERKLPEEHPGGWNFDVLFSPRKESRHWYPRQILNFSLGFIGGVNQTEGVHLNMGQSIELELGNIFTAQTPVGRNGIVLVGLGIGWRNYRMTNQRMFAKHDDGSIAIEPYPEGAEPKFSRIHTFGFILPLKGKQLLKDNHLHFNKFTLGVGAEFVVQGLGIYYKYNPFNVLDTDYGPKFSSMTVGLKVAL